MKRDEPNERLERLLAATNDVRARGDFVSRVMTAVERTPAPSGLWLELPRVAKLIVPVAMLAAAASVVWALQAARAVDDASLANQAGPEQSVVATLYGAELE